jgi:hypothetical protein
MPSCEKCGCDCDAAELRELAGKKVCEDCYLGGVELTQTCDPWAVHSAKNTLSADGKVHLTEIQQQIYDLIVQEKKLTPEEAASRLNIPETELRREFATLRHLELLKGEKTADGVIITTF